jgi:CxxC motif-containing protein
MNREITCIVCPNGCTLNIDFEKNGDGKTSVTSVRGNLCPRGRDYAVQEMESPMRTIASSVLVTGGELPLASVRTNAPIPKERIFDVMKEVRKVTVAAPVSAGDVIIKDVLGLGVDIIATKDVMATLV